MSNCDRILQELGRSRWRTFITEDNDCWLWTGSRTRSGYGVVRYEGQDWRLHRLLFTATGGTLLRGHDLHHLCANRNCVNPAHVEQITKREHLEKHNHQNLRAWHERQRSKTHCVHGHEFTPENTLIKSWKGRPRRDCKACQRERLRSSREKVRRALDHPPLMVTPAEQLTVWDAV